MADDVGAGVDAGADAGVDEGITEGFDAGDGDGVCCGGVASFSAAGGGGTGVGASATVGGAGFSIATFTTPSAMTIAAISAIHPNGDRCFCSGSTLAAVPSFSRSDTAAVVDSGCSA